MNTSLAVTTVRWVVYTAALAIAVAVVPRCDTWSTAMVLVAGTTATVNVPTPTANLKSRVLFVAALAAVAVVVLTSLFVNNPWTGTCASPV